MRNLTVAGVLLAAFVMLSSAATADVTTREANADTSGGTPQANAGFITIDDDGGGGEEGEKSRSGPSLTCKRYNSLWFGGMPQGLGEVDSRSKPAEESRAPLGQELKPGDRYGLVCTDANGQEVVNEIRQYDPANPDPGAIDPEVLAEEAKQNLPLPLPGVQTSPPPERDQLVNLPTWLAVENWGPQSATASVPGVSATVTATPTEVVWNMGNGEQVVCRGPGKLYDFSRTELQQTSDCTYTYPASSAGQPGLRYQASATMTWSVSWTASGAAGGGDLGEVSRTTTFPMRVAEGQALVSEAG